MLLLQGKINIILTEVVKNVSQNLKKLGGPVCRQAGRIPMPVLAVGMRWWSSKSLIPRMGRGRRLGDLIG